jgi:hypothetical protein
MAAAWSIVTNYVRVAEVTFGDKKLDFWHWFATSSGFYGLA